jgi:hypothetical protein
LDRRQLERGQLGGRPRAAAQAHRVGRDGAGKWQAGPALAIVYTGVKNFVVGGVFQNPILFAGNSDRPAVSALAVTPTLTYTFPSGWFAGYIDYDLVFDWKASGTTIATVPLGVQGGKVIKLGGKPFSVSAEAGYNVIRPEGTATPRWMFGIEFTAILGNQREADRRSRSLSRQGVAKRQPTNLAIRRPSTVLFPHVAAAPRSRNDRRRPLRDPRRRIQL